MEPLNDAVEDSDFSIDDDSDYEQDVLPKENFLAEDEDDDESLLQILSQYQSQKAPSQRQETVQSNSDSNDSDLDDSDLEMLINK